MKITLNNDKKLAVINKFMNFGTKYAVVMIPINEEQEKEIDTTASIQINNLLIADKDIYCYGNIDFYNEEDIKGINSFDWIPDNKGVVIPAKFDYETNTCETINMKIGHHETFDNLKVSMYCHAAIGKPERCLIFKCKADYVPKIFD